MKYSSELIIIIIIKLMIYKNKSLSLVYIKKTYRLQTILNLPQNILFYDIV